MELMYGRDNQHPDYPMCDWGSEANDGDTVLGYHDWVMHCVERDKEDPK